MLASDFYDLIDSFAPFNLACDWDNSGFQVGNKDKVINRVAFALDPSFEVVKEAIDIKADLLITHHPLIFSPLKSLCSGSSSFNIINCALKNDLTILCCHTNWDAAGVSLALAELLELRFCEILEQIPENLLKLVVFVPKDSIKEVMDSLFASGAGTIGDYKDCSFRAEGIGSFFPLDGTNPTIGKRGEFTEVEEVRIELIVRKHLKNIVTRALLEAHPYETPAYEFYDILVPGNYGFGIIGSLSTPTEPLSFVSQKLNLTNFCHTSFMPSKVTKVALLPGSGGSYVKIAKNRGAELLITGDLKHHDAILACELGLGVISAGHFETENPSMDYLLNMLQKMTKDAKVDYRRILGSSPISYYRKV
jgi:dinuclear metal center YbgI/SA1388 family protein